MASLKDIKKRITTVQNTQQITKAMKMVSAAKLRRAQQAVEAARPYADKIAEVLASLSLRVEEEDQHPLLQERGKDRALIVLITADRGLCGGFTANISKAVERHVQEKRDGFGDYDVMIIGRKGHEFLKRRPVQIEKVHENITGNVTYASAQLLAQEIIDGYLADRWDAVYLAYNAFHSAISQEVTIAPIMPVEPQQPPEDEPVIDYIYEPSIKDVLAQIVPKYVETQMFRALLESAASEHGARMTSMDNASKNASEMIDNLTLEYNRARQAAITKELSEIVSGAESIKG